MMMAPLFTLHPHPVKTLQGFQRPSGIYGTILFLLFLTACNSHEASHVSHGGPVRDHVSLVDSLRGQGLTVDPMGPISQPFFPVPGHILTVDGKDIQVFEFTDASAAKSQAREVSADGTSIGPTMVHWRNPPHFFSKGKIIVLYVGTDTSLLQQLEKVLGRPFAGGEF